MRVLVGGTEGGLVRLFVPMPCKDGLFSEGGFE
jgi:hypothetical protein